MTKPINLNSKFNIFTDHWSPKVIAEMNDYQFKLVKIKGEFIKHQHSDTDEVFIVIEGKMNIEFESHTIQVKSGGSSGSSSSYTRDPVIHVANDAMIHVVYVANNGKKIKRAVLDPEQL